ncbi:MAG: transposase, partial [Deltaproteobacteria bacterium]|nr:transposase [Deltaproteobacteria bacterium]
MIGKPNQLEPKLFCHGVSLERRIGPDHPLRMIKQLIDFNFIRSQVKDLYGEKGNQSVDPTVILKLIFLLFYENIKSERRLMCQLPLRMDWLWFCDYDIDDTTPHHSVLSKARTRWGADVFEQFFIHVLDQCITAGLVDGETIHIDASFIDGNADIDKVQPNLHLITKQLSERLDDDIQEHPEDIDNAKADYGDDSSDNFEISGDTPNTKISPTDPDSRIGRKYGKSTLGYKDHRVVDDQCGVIT